MTTSERPAHRPSLSEGLRCSTCRRRDCPGCAPSTLHAANRRPSARGLPIIQEMPPAARIVESTLVEEPDQRGDQAAAPPTAPAPLPLRAVKARAGRMNPRKAIWLLAIAMTILVGLPMSALAFLRQAPATATVTIYPRYEDRRAEVSVLAVTTPPTPSQSAARLLTTTRTTSAVTVKATGVVQVPAEEATGTLTFYNEASSSQTVPAGLLFTTAGGVPVTNVSAVVLPAGNPPSLGVASIPAQATSAGAQGNIAAGAINGLCNCNLPGVAVKNLSPFTGGRDATSYSVVAQADIDRAAPPSSLSQLQQQALSDLEAQVQATERLVAAPQCRAQAVADHGVGSQATQVSVSMRATCKGEAYDLQDALAKASASFERQVESSIDPHERLLGRITTRLTSVSVGDAARGTLTVRVRAHGLWVYQIDLAARRILASHLAGKTRTEAVRLLAQMPGVQNASLQQSGGTEAPLPSDATAITILVILPRSQS
jgi:hypothetical protein